MYVLLGIVLILFIVTGSIGYFFSNVVTRPKVFPVQKTYDIDVERGEIKPDEFAALPQETVTIKSPYGYDLFGIYFPQSGSKKTVIICHGITWSLYGSVKYMNMFYKRGYNVLMYDHRFHGRSGGPNTTFGFYEKADLQACIDWVKARCGHDSLVGVHGESMGAAIILQTAAIEPRIDFLVADCPFSDLTELLNYRLKVEFHLPAFPFLHLASLCAYLRTGFNFNSVSPMRDLTKVTQPIFFVHGQKDSYIPPQMSKDMYAMKKGMKKLYLAPNARHAESFWVNQEEYTQLVNEFLDAIGA